LSWQNENKIAAEMTELKTCKQITHAVEAEWYMNVGYREWLPIPHWKLLKTFDLGDMRYLRQVCSSLPLMLIEQPWYWWLLEIANHSRNANAANQKSLNEVWDWVNALSLFDRYCILFRSSDGAKSLYIWYMAINIWVWVPVPCWKLVKPSVDRRNAVDHYSFCFINIRFNSAELLELKDS
jgi:hypothetical protein